MDQLDSKRKDCRSCRLVGSATLFGIATYILYNTKSNYYMARPYQKLFVGALSIGRFLLDHLKQIFF